MEAQGFLTARASKIDRVRSLDTFFNLKMGLTSESRVSANFESVLFLILPALGAVDLTVADFKFSIFRRLAFADECDAVLCAISYSFAIQAFFCS